jgi:hypothetical protein
MIEGSFSHREKDRMRESGNQSVSFSNPLTNYLGPLTNYLNPSS